MSHSDWRNTLARRRLASDEEAAAFFELARRYARKHGTAEPAYICGYCGVAGFVYEDERVEISAAAEGPALEIRFKYPDGTCTNPVIMVTEQGEPIRVHGEHCYVVPHVEELTARPEGEDGVVHDESRRRRHD